MVVVIGEHRWRFRTRFLIDGQRWYACAGTPCDQLTRIIQKRLQRILLSALWWQMQDDTQVLRHSGQRLHISRDELRRAMVVVQYGAHAVVEGVVDLTQPYIDAEDDVDGSEQEEVQ